MSYALFILLNAILLIRPEELRPDWAGTHLYQFVIMFCLVAALPRLLEQLTPAELEVRPISVCVLGLLVAAALSHLARGRFDAMTEYVPEFAKAIAYYLLLVALVDTPARLKAFLGWQVLFVAVLAVLGVLRFHESIDIEAIKPVMVERIDPSTGESVKSARLCSSGIFNDPNDLCLILVFGGLCCLYRAAVAADWLVKIVWLLPIGLFGYALVLTQSRGGLLGMLVAFATLVFARLKRKWALPLVIACAAAALVIVGGRKEDVIRGDTAHERIMLWADGFSALFRSPFFVPTGIGVEQYVEETNQVAHNSFVHAYVEMGLLGGTLFLGAFLMALWMLWDLRRFEDRIASLELRAARPYVMAMVAGYCGGMYSLSRNYIVPTYMSLGIATAYLAMAMPDPPARFRVSRTWAVRLALIGILGLVFLKFFTQFAGALGL
jgi:hypothetical protein